MYRCLPFVARVVRKWSWASGLHAVPRLSPREQREGDSKQSVRRRGSPQQASSASASAPGDSKSAAASSAGGGETKQEGTPLLSSSEEDDARSPGTNWLYTNRGLATHPPMRLFCHQEVTLLTLYPADEQSEHRHEH